MRILAVGILAILTVGSSAKQFRKPKLGSDQGIQPCKPQIKKRGRPSWDYGYAELREASIEDSKGKLIEQRKDGSLNYRVDKEYFISVKISVKKSGPFGSVPKFLGVKISENYTSADDGTKAAFKQIYQQEMVGPVHQCSPGQGRGDKADGCRLVPRAALVPGTKTCPMEEEGEEIELRVPFRVPKLLNAASVTMFRLIGLEERVDRRGCEAILNPSIPNPIDTTADTDMICFKYHTHISR